MTSLMLLLTFAWAGELRVGRELWLALQEPAPDPPQKAPAPWVRERELRLSPTGPDEVAVSAHWLLEGRGERWVDAKLFGPGIDVEQVLVNGRAAPLTRTDAGTFVTLRVDASTEVVAEGVVFGTLRQGVHLEALPAAIGELRIDSAAGRPWVAASGSVVHEGDRIWTGSEVLDVQLVDERIQPAGVLAVARVGLGLTVSDAAVQGQATVSWTLSRGELSEAGLIFTGAPADLQLTGPSVASWRREGDRIRVVLRGSQKGYVRLDLSWSLPVANRTEQTLSLPKITPEGAFRTETSVQIARDGDLEVVPSLPGWEAVSAAQLGSWGRNLVTGTPTAAYTSARSGAPGTLELYRFEPVSGPATLVDVAAYTVAASEEGRWLVRAHYAVRNDRGSHLRVGVPDGLELIGARVSGKTARVARDEQGKLLIPLEKSVETVEGLLSFPVELILLGERGAWDSREEGSLPLPTVGASVAVSRLTVHLPPGFESRLDAGRDAVVEGFSEGQGITYGLAVGDAKVAEADQLFQEAVTAWMDNRFDAVQDNLDSLRSIGAENENMRRLQSNVDALYGESAGASDVAESRRVKDHAKARSKADSARQEVLIEEAKESYLSGDYGSSAGYYQEALELGERLAVLEQDESREVVDKNLALVEELKKVQRENQAEVLIQADVGSAEKERSAGALGLLSETEISFDFDDLVIDGELTVAGGVVGGAVGGVFGSGGGGMAGGGVATGHGQAVPSPEVSGRGFGVGSGGFGTRGRSRDAPAQDRRPERPEPVPSLDVTATALSVVVPTQGQAVRYQHLLLSPGEQVKVRIRANKKRRSKS